MNIYDHTESFSLEMLPDVLIYKNTIREKYFLTISETPCLQILLGTGFKGNPLSETSIFMQHTNILSKSVAWSNKSPKTTRMFMLIITNYMLTVDSHAFVPLKEETEYIKGTAPHNSDPQRHRKQ